MNISKALAVLAAVSLVSCGSSSKENSSASAKEETKTLAEQLTERQNRPNTLKTLVFPMFL